MIAPDPTVRLRLATRIHFALLRYCGEPVGVGTLLDGGSEALEALWVCQASGNAELVSLALQFTQTATAPAARRPTPSDHGVAVRHAAPQDAAWAQDTSGFGVSRPADGSEPADDGEPATRAPAPAHWLNPAGWRRRHAAR